jgi:hypothetical protein
VRHSLNEIELTLRKAAVGAGYPYGLAEDIGQAGAWLCAHGLGGVPACLAALEADPGQSQPVVLQDRTPSFPDARIGQAGPSAIDLLLSDADNGEVRLTNIDTPLLLIGLAGVAASAGKTGFALRFSNGCTVDIGEGGLAVSGTPPEPGADADLARTEIAQTDTAVPDHFEAVAGGFNVGDDLWAEVLSLAARTYVPASEASRARGAGAGDIDND